ncbi:polyprenyl synthetase family protein [Vitreoscilla massiliensis]|uniref:Polyprenyl synthetase family protein n=1 Tax=Vitreoscilla massiliensis TaxID=1689272 RepID=A0ABY4E9H3_9NEIS|nr:farnesyl diphosphate synthase [Vitreoscilla massiliensis]UOO91158.1 polyprenyl synthetase family protein [Vitreoscilla massiliensis]
MTIDFPTWMADTQAQAETAVERYLPTTSTGQERLHEAMTYVSVGGGKRFRPLLVAAAARLGAADAEALSQAMAAIEYVHVYSLVHDDMPEMDNDSLRRGKPTCHVAYDQATALLVGDALQTLAFDVLSRPVNLPAAQQLQRVQVLARASGSEGMAGGQGIDLANVGQDLSLTQLQHMHGLKTGALIRAAVALGGLSCSDVSDALLRDLDVYADKLGLAFQVIDDVLDCEQDTATLGKTAGKDEEANKPTYVKLLGLDGARAQAIRLADEAKAAVAAYGDAAAALLGLADYVIKRNH